MDLAAGDAALMGPALVRTVLDEHAAAGTGAGTGVGEGAVLVRSQGAAPLAAEWACAVPLAGRDRDWILVAERLLLAAVDAEHEAAGRLRAAEAGARAAAARPAAGRRPLFKDGDPAHWSAAVRADIARMPQDLAGRLLQALVAAAHPGGPAAAPHRSVRMIRAVAASPLVRDVELTAPAVRRDVFHEDLDRICPGARHVRRADAGACRPGPGQRGRGRRRRPGRADRAVAQGRGRRQGGSPTGSGPRTWPPASPPAACMTTRMTTCMRPRPARMRRRRPRPGRSRRWCGGMSWRTG
ncbi:hypothetical protein ABR737_00020 [Streptomyces sp. Edi2]|uniref:hypothetical protein n=1 Tax=Streptomyces sp. Edi2 TaxID=3162528 RepID=UPI00330618C6